MLTVLQRLRHQLPADCILTDPGQCRPYGHDNSRQHAQPLAVVLASETRDVIATVQACHATATPLTARGRGTATTGAAIPNAGGVVLSLERMNRILRIDPANRIAEVQAGVLNGDLQQALQAHALFWPPDPTSAPYSTIGGNLACNAGGPRTVKYGASRDHLLSVLAVDGRGELFQAGHPTSKSACGYDLARLLIGSEGTLAVIVEASLRLLPRPRACLGARATYTSLEAACAAVAAIMAQPTTPSALEFMDGAALALLHSRAIPGIPQAAALLLLEVDGDPETLPPQLQALRAAAHNSGSLSFEAATDAETHARLWAARKALSPVLRDAAPGKINEDVVVPVSRIPELIGAVQHIARRSGLHNINFGHAGNGNIHVNFLLDPRDPAQVQAGALATEALFDTVLALGGTLSGEHGIGLAKRAWMKRALHPHTYALHQQIKAVLDPAGILNPGKIFEAPFQAQRTSAPDSGPAIDASASA